MKLLIFGGSGMLGSALIQEAERLNYEVLAPTHQQCSITNGMDVHEAVRESDIVINAAGRIPNSLGEYMANAIGPFNIAKTANLFGNRFLHISTDCVFSGRPGPWHTIEDIPDPMDLYGVSKRYGEVAVEATCPNAVILRTSFIGPKHGLMHWFLNLPKDSVVEGYHEALWSGSSVYEVARRIMVDVLPHAGRGIQHLAIETPMTKNEVLLELKKAFRQDVTVVRVPHPVIHRALKPSIVMHDIRASIPELLKASR